MPYPVAPSNRLLVASLLAVVLGPLLLACTPAPELEWPIDCDCWEIGEDGDVYCSSCILNPCALEECA